VFATVVPVIGSSGQIWLGAQSQFSVSIRYYIYYVFPNSGPFGLFKGEQYELLIASAKETEKLFLNLFAAGPPHSNNVTRLRLNCQMRFKFLLPKLRQICVVVNM
jgi:hypothetical protein